MRICIGRDGHFIGGVTSKCLKFPKCLYFHWICTSQEFAQNSLHSCNKRLIPYVLEQMRWQEWCNLRATPVTDRKISMKWLFFVLLAIKSEQKSRTWKIVGTNAQQRFLKVLVPYRKLTDSSCFWLQIVIGNQSNKTFLHFVVFPWSSILFKFSQHDNRIVFLI